MSVDTDKLDLTTCELAATPSSVLGSALRRLRNAWNEEPSDITSVEKTKGMRRNNRASLARWREQALHELDPLVKQLDKSTLDEFRDFVHRMENGIPQATPELDSIGRPLREMLDDRRQALQARGKLQEYNDHYFPHLWEKYAKSRRNFERARKFVSIEEGLDAGLTPLSYNPVRMVLAHIEQVDRFLADEDSFQEAKNFDYVEWVNAGKKPPEGWVPLKASRFNPKVNALDEGHFKDYGRYWAPEPVARLFNHAFEPGLRGRWWYDVIHNYGMLSNTAQLGLSAFHATFSALNASADQMALGLEQFINEGKFGEGLTNIVTSPVASIRYLVKGNAMMQAYLDPTRQVKLQRLVDALELGGGRAYMDTFYSTNALDRFRTAWKEFHAANTPMLKTLKGGKVVFRALERSIDLMNKPILEMMVPRMKLAAFANAAEDALSRMPETVGLDERRKIFGQIWDRVDNRFGELVYDNLFWSKSAKDLGLLSVRSLGWNIGSVREFGGAAADWAKFMTGKNRFTNRMGYTLALPIINGLINSVYTYLATGQLPHGMDYIAARDGKLNPDGTPHRVWPPTYIKDIANVSTAIARDRLSFPTLKNIAGVVGNKLNPALEQAYNLAINRDYYGREIFHGGESFGQTLKDAADYIGRTDTPISIQNVREIRNMGGGSGEQLQNFVGITPTPRHLADTPTEVIIDNAMTRVRATGPMLQADYDKMRFESRLRNEFREHNVNKKDLQTALKNPAIGSAGLQRIEKEAQQNPLVYNFKRIPFRDAVRALEYASPAERKLLLPVMRQRFPELLKQPVEEQPAYRQKLRAIFQGK